MASGRKLLVVDDSLTIQKVIRLALANEGYEIQAVSHGDEVLQQMALFRPDIVLIDISIPGKDTLDIRQESLNDPELSHSQFVVMSSAFETVDEGKLKSLEIHGRLIKPFDPSHLRQVLDDVMKRPSPSNAQKAPKPAPDIFETASPAPPPFQPMKSGEDDIRNLTETTIKMSGLDHFEWSVDDGGIMSEPLPKPVLVSQEKVANLHETSPDLPPPMNYVDTEDNSFRIDSVSVEETTPSFIEKPEPTIPIETFHPQSGASAEVMPLTTEQMEKLMAHQFEKVLEQVARKMFPQIAEKIIRDEIRKLLANPP